MPCFAKLVDNCCCQPGVHSLEPQSDRFTNPQYRIPQYECRNCSNFNSSKHICQYLSISSCCIIIVFVCFYIHIRKYQTDTQFGSPKIPTHEDLRSDTRLRGVHVGVDAVFWLRSIQALKDPGEPFETSIGYRVFMRLLAKPWLIPGSSHYLQCFL